MSKDKCIVIEDWSEPIYIDDIDDCEPKKCKPKIKHCEKPKRKNKCKDYKVAGFVDDLHRYHHEWNEYKPGCDHGHGHGGHHGGHGHGHGHGHHGGHKKKAPCMPDRKIFINADCAGPSGGPNGLPFRFRLPLPLSETGGPSGFDYDGFMISTVYFSGYINVPSVDGPLWDEGTQAYLILDIVNETPCGRSKLMDRRAINVPLPEWVPATDDAEGYWLPAVPFVVDFTTNRKCLDFRGHVKFQSYFVLTDGTAPDLRGELIADNTITGAFSDNVDPTFEITTLPVNCDKRGNLVGGHGQHHGGHNGCFHGRPNCHRGSSCGDRRCR